MNRGLLRGFTKIVGGQPVSAANPRMRVLHVPSGYTGTVLHAGNVDTLLLMDTASPWSITMGTLSLPEGVQIHLAQWGASQLTIVAGTGVTIRTASTLKTRAQYSVITLTKTSSTLEEWLLTGDME